MKAEGSLFLDDNFVIHGVTEDNLDCDSVGAVILGFTRHADTPPQSQDF
jgi:hypothetical protein